MNKTRGLSYLLGLWIVANAVVLSFLILNPMHQVHECNTIELSRGRFRSCGDYPRPVINRKYLIAGAVLGNGVALGAWVALRGRQKPQPPD